MIGVVIVTHGGLAGALLNAAELIMGKQEQIAVVEFELGDAIADLQVRTAQAVQKVDTNQGVLLLVDLVGGSPYNVTAMLAMQKCGIEVVTGINLPMLLEVLPARNLELETLADLALESGSKGINKFVISSF